MKSNSHVHQLYISLLSIETKIRPKNKFLSVSLEAHLKDGSLIENCFRIGSSRESSYSFTAYPSTLCTNFQETALLELENAHILQNAHIIFTIKTYSNRSDKKDPDVTFAFTPLIQSNNKVVLPSIIHSLNVVRSSTQNPNYLPLSNLTLLDSGKDILNFEMKLNSNVKTQNIYLFNLLEWKSVSTTSLFIDSDANVNALSTTLVNVNQQILNKGFECYSILGMFDDVILALFTMLNVTTCSSNLEALLSGPLDRDIFNVLVSLFSVIQQENLEWCMVSYREFCQEVIGIVAPRSWYNLMQTLSDFISLIEDDQNFDYKILISVCSIIFDGIISSWSCFKMTVGEECIF